MSEWRVSAEAKYVFGCCLSVPKRTKRFPLNYWTTQVLHLLSAFKVAKTESYFSFKILQGQGTSTFYHVIIILSMNSLRNNCCISHNKDKVGHFPGSESFVPGATFLLTNHCLQIWQSWFAVWWSSESPFSAFILVQYKFIFHFCLVFKWFLGQWQKKNYLVSKEKQYYNMFVCL